MQIGGAGQLVVGDACGGAPLEILQGGDAESLLLVTTASGDVTFQLDDTGMEPVLNVIGSSTMCDLPPIYLRGDLTDWTVVSSAYEFMETSPGSNVYEVTLVSVAAGPYEFKPGDELWSAPLTLDFTKLTSDTSTVTLTEGAGGNFAITIPATGSYVFRMDFNAGSIEVEPAM